MYRILLIFSIIPFVIYGKINSNDASKLVKDYLKWERGKKLVKDIKTCPFVTLLLLKG